MAKLFRDSEEVHVDGYKIVREERHVMRDDLSAGGSYKSKTYTFQKP